MPTPTIIIPFGESEDGQGFAVVELDSKVNTDRYGNEITEFIDTEQVNILVHVEKGSKVLDISTSYGSIINSNNPKLVTRDYSNEEIVFKGIDDEFTLPYYPSTGVTIEWKGRERNVSIIGRKLRCNGGAGICSISYKYEAYQYILDVPSLNLNIGESFPVEVSFNIE